jgi:hypothetical protein
MDHWIYQDAEYLKAWIEMLLRARYAKEPGTEMIDGELITVNYGEFLYGRVKWSDRLKISEQRLRTLLKKLMKDDMLEKVSEHRKCTLYRIKNYENYQNFNHLINQQINQQQILAYQEIAATTNQQTNAASTASQPAANQQLTTKEQRNKVNKEIKKDLKEYRPEITELTDFLVYWIKQNNQNAKIPTDLSKWHDEMDKLERLDNYDTFQIRTVIDWCQQDSFWKSNILSVPKLREKMSTLVLQMQRGQARPTGGKVTSFERLKQLAKEAEAREASGHY